MKLGSLFGNLLKVDCVMVMEGLLYYSRILIEVFIDDELFDFISFENE